MDFHKLLSQLDAINAPLLECNGDTTPHTPPSLTVNINAHGMDDISSLMKLISKVNPDTASHKMISDPIDMDGEEDGELDNDDDEGAIGGFIGSKLGSMAGGAAGTAVAGPVGGVAGATVGGMAGQKLGSAAGDAIYNKFGGNAIGNAVSKFNTALTNRQPQAGATTPGALGKLGSMAGKAADIATDYITNDALPESISLESQIRTELQERLTSFKMQ